MNNGISILLVDDDEATNYLHQRVIRKWGRADHVQVCDSGVDALDYLKTPVSGTYPKPTLVFLDINMPGMDGWEFLEHYEHLPQEQRARAMVIMLTTSLNPDDRQRSDELPAITGFLSKPLTIDMLNNAMAKHFPEFVKQG